MNCQDITRFADTGSFANLSAAERQAAEAHALTCRHCVPVWAAHARLAELSIPQMPAELAVRVRTLAASPVPMRGRSALRRWTLVGAVVVLAAAAGMLAVKLAGERTPEALPAVVHVAVEPASAAVPAAAPAPVVPALVAAVKPPAALPLLPAPDNREANRKFASAMEEALQKAVDRHPDLVEGADIGGTFIVVMTMRANGNVVDSTARLVESADRVEVGKEVAKELTRTPIPMMDSTGASGSTYEQHTLVPDGRPLRARVFLNVTRVSNEYDVTRSKKRVEEIVRARYANLILPTSGGQMNRLTVLLADDGSVQRDDVEQLNMQNAQFQINVNNMNGYPRVAEDIAARLQIDVGQLGLVGALPIMVAIAAPTPDANGNHQLNDMRMLLVNYAWPRRETEKAPTYTRSVAASSAKLDLVAALAIVKQVIPDAFYDKSSAAGTPTVVLNVKGEVVRAGRQRTVNGKDLTGMLESRPGSGVSPSTVVVQPLRDETGATAEVWFAWEMPLTDAAK